MPTRIAAAVCAALILLQPSAVSGWGTRGHQMASQAALKKLPAGMPAFLLAAGPGLKYLASEPDLWRNAEQRALASATGSNHTFKWEVVPKPLPGTRYRFLMELVRAGKITPDKSGLADYGTSAYAVVESVEMLTALFRRWRSAPSETADQLAAKRQLEQNIIYAAGILSHWVEDSSNPMHVSIHVHGWSPLVPNPNGYEGKDLHGRYESRYLDRVITPEDVEHLVPAEPRLLGDWLTETANYIEANNRHVEQIFIWDKAAPFGSGKEPAEARAFTAARLADGARMVRDMWYSAWIKSGEPAPK